MRTSTWRKCRRSRYDDAAQHGCIAARAHAGEECAAGDVQPGTAEGTVPECGLPPGGNAGDLDMMTLLSTVASLLERMPVKSVRLVMFNLEQQKELYRNADFHLAEMPEI